jgi:hypothetical protein
MVAIEKVELFAGWDKDLGMLAQTLVKPGGCCSLSPDTEKVGQAHASFRLTMVEDTRLGQAAWLGAPHFTYTSQTSKLAPLPSCC